MILNSRPSRTDVSRQIAQIQGSARFRAAPQLAALLEYVVHQALDGKAGDLNAQTLATGFFGRDSDYDPQNDPIVAIQMDRLRRQLGGYYRNTGKHDPLRITIPQGTCVPTFSRQGDGK